MDKSTMFDSGYAPIMIPTLCRFEHLKSCIESLAKCELSNETDLYISLDYPVKESHWEGYRKIKEYLEAGVLGFRNVYIYKQDKNLGAEGNWRFLHDIIEKRYQYYIGTEDDNVFSDNFLQYINEGLKMYIDDEKVFAICGYSFPIVELEKMNTSFLYHAFSAWGFGSWFKKEKEFTKVQNNPLYPKNVLSSFKNVRKLMNESTSTLDNLITMTAMGVLHGDTINETKIVIEEYKCLFPTLTKVKNNGHDGSGVHCGNLNQELFDSQILDKTKGLKLVLAKGNEKQECESAFHSYKCGNGKEKKKVWLKYLIYRLHLYSILRNTQKIKSIIKHT